MSAYEKIFLMNTLIGHKPIKPNTEEFWTQIRNQCERVTEEVDELFNAILDEDTEQVLDGISDAMVTVIGLYQKLAQCGYPVEEGLDRVCDNNLTKFHTDAEAANKTVQFYKDAGVETFVRFIKLDNGSEYYGVIRKADNKLMKPVDFQPVVLKDLVSKVYEVKENWVEENLDERDET